MSLVGCRAIIEFMQVGAEKASAAVAVVFDGDDTLWSTEPLYDDARARAREVVAESGRCGADWEALERRIDLENVAILGYAAERFPTSCVQAYEQLVRSQGLTPDREVAERVRRAACSVFERDPLLLPEVESTLAALRSRGIRLALLTKGDPAVQSRRVERSGLRGYFDLVSIVSEKSPLNIRNVVESLGTNVESTWMVGNSVRSDVLPALSAGLRAIWIDAHVWEHERAHDQFVDDRVISASRISDVPSIVAP